MTDSQQRRIEYMPLSELVTRLHPENPKEHHVGLIVESYKSHGFVTSGVLDERTGLFLAGHGRIKALQAMKQQRMSPPDGIKNGGDDWLVPVQIGYASKNDMQAKAYLAADNKLTIAGGWDEPALAELLQELANSDELGIEASGFDGDELDDLLRDLGQVEEPTEDPGAQIDKAAELNKKWQVQRGDVWEIPSSSGDGVHRIMCGDSTCAEDVAVLMGGAEIEVVWTDPPYGVAIGDKNKFLNSIARSNRVEENLENDTLDEPQLMDMLCKAFDVAIEYCIAGAAWYVAAPPGPLHVIFGQVLKERGIWRQTIQWVKNNATFSPMGVDYHWKSEPIFYGWLPNAGHRYYGGRQQTTVWEIDRPTKSPEHPTMKPVELVVRAIENSSRPNECIYDLFCGSGTTIVACEQTGRIGYGMEIAPDYVAVCLERLAGMGLEAKLVNKNPVSEAGGGA
jgi:DNA modification methylase